MREPLAWNTLDESAAFLSELTGENWEPRRLLDAAIRLPAERAHNPVGATNKVTLISAALPEGHTLVRCLLNVGEGRKKIDDMPWLSPEARTAALIPLNEMPAQPVPLLQTDLMDLLAAGWVRLTGANIVRVPSDIADPPKTIISIEPPATVRFEDVVLRGSDLSELAQRISNSRQDMDRGAVGTPGALSNVSLSGSSCEHVAVSATAPPTSSAAVEPVADPVTPKADDDAPSGVGGPVPLTTRDIAEALDGIAGKDAKAWADLLGDAKGNARWALPARVEVGARRGAPARWNPLELAKILIRENRTTSDRIDRAFREREVLTPWLKEWRRGQSALRAQLRDYGLD